MRFLGKIIGVIIGSSAGVFGAFLGLIIGHLVDQIIGARKEEKDMQGFLMGDIEAELCRLNDQELILLSCTGLCVEVLQIRSALSPTQMGLIRNRLREIAETPILPGRRINSMAEAALNLPRDINVEWLCSFLQDKLSEKNREWFAVFLVSLLPVGTANGMERYSRLLFIAQKLGIRPQVFDSMAYGESTELKDAYKILGVRQDSSLKEIKRVYRNLASQFHPDTASVLSKREQQQTMEAFIRIQRAYNVILGRKKKFG